MEKQAITVIIAGRPYRLTINKKDEEIVRNAAKLIETRMNVYSNNYAYKDQQDLLAMASLQFATSTLNYEKEADFRIHNLYNSLVEIDRLITEALD
ncbi:MAG: cell division protein ZapA [Bacteroidales bacterium]|jgi:cell division protein ZapA|nr:cell division protein ZapA [Bacteroidales bacterium]